MAKKKETEEFNLNNHLFEACNILRGPINQDDYKSYVTPLLFFKRISDVYDEETKVALEESGGDYEYVGSNYDNRIVAIKYLKVLCRKGVLSDGIYERLVLKERKLLEENQ